MEVRIVVIAVLAIAVVVLALATRQWQRPVHGLIDATGRGLPEGWVVFTSTDCANCKQAIAELKTTDLPIREVTWELEPHLFEELGVESVPLTMRIDAVGRNLAQTVGVPGRRWLRRTAG